MKRSVSLPFLVVFIFFSLVPLSQAADQDIQLTKTDMSGKVFSLSDCVSIALDKSPQVLYSQADIIEKEYSLDSSKKELYPSLFFNYGYRYAPDAYSPFDVENYYNYTFSIEQPVYRGRSIVTGVELGEL